MSTAGSLIGLGPDLVPSWVRRLSEVVKLVKAVKGSSWNTLKSIANAASSQLRYLKQARVTGLVIATS